MREQRAVEFEAYSGLSDTWVAMQAYPSEAGGPSVYTHDITDRRRAEEALRDANRRSETILGSISDSFVAFDGEWSFTYLKPARTGRPALHARAVEHGAAAVLDKLTHLGQVAEAVRQIWQGSDCCCQSRTSAELNPSLLEPGGLLAWSKI